MKARKLLDFQNEVEGIASKSPNDLTVMFEDISESTELRESHDATTDSDNNRHRRRFDEVLANMHIRAVSGRLSELCEPTQDRYKVAVEIPFDKVMDAVDFDNGRIAVEFISCLKEIQTGAAIFIRSLTSGRSRLMTDFAVSVGLPA